RRAEPDRSSSSTGSHAELEGCRRAAGGPSKAAEPRTGGGHMRRVAAPLVALLLMVATTTEAGVLAMVVADATYARVWDAAVRAVEGYPIERADEGTIVTGWLERPPREGEPAFTRVLERLT